MFESCAFNVGGCFFSIPLSRLSCFHESLLLEEASALENGSRLFIDRDGCTFRHVHYYIHTGKLPSSCASEVNMLYELATGLRLQSLQQALENVQLGKHYLRARPMDLQVTERATLNYWKTRISNTKQETVVSPVYSMHDTVPLGLVGSPLVESEEEVLYCFVPLEQVHMHPGLLAHDNLLWLCDEVAIIECGSHLFRFIANFLQSGTVLLPEWFSDHEALRDEARVAGVTDFVEALQEGRNWSEWDSLGQPHEEGQLSCVLEPLYALSLGLLVKYPDSSLGQLYVDSNLEGSRFYITGTGVLFQHVESWLGTSRLPLTRSREELPSLCAHLNKQDGTYLAFREALREHFHRRETSSLSARSCSVSVTTSTFYKVIRVYAGTHWYATYFKTLIKHPEFLCNSAKSSWIVFGESVLVKGDGRMFRHILNFLRCSRLLLPEGFREWPLLCQEIEAFQIPALSSALLDCSEYRAWCRVKDQDRKNTFPPSQFMKDRDHFLDTSSDDERESPDYTVHSTDVEATSSHSETESVCISLNTSSLNSEERQRTGEISPASLHHPSPIDKLIPYTLSACGEPMTNSSTRLPSKSAAVSGQASGRLPSTLQGAPAGAWTSSPLQSVWESWQEEDLLAPGAEASASGSRSEVKCMQADGRRSAVTSLLVKGFNTHRRQRSALRERLHRDRRPEHDWDLPQPANTAFGLKQTLGVPGCKGAQDMQCNSTECTHGTNTPTHRQNRSHSRKPYARTPSGWRAVRRESVEGSVFPAGNCRVSVGGCVLRVDHPPVLGRGEAGGYFIHSTIYTAADQPPLVQPAGAETKDVAFASFSLSYEEMVYARECHAFLTGTILNSSMSEPKQSTQSIASLVYSLWTDQAAVEDFVQDLLTLMHTQLHRQPEQRKKLIEWLRFTLPLAKRYAECVSELLRKMPLQTDTVFPLDLLEHTVP